MKFVELGRLGKTQTGGTPSTKRPEFFGGEIPWIGTTALNGGLLTKADAIKLITQEAIDGSATKIVPAGSIMVGIRVGVGKVAVNTVPMCTSQDIVSIVGIDEAKWNKEYVSYAIQAKAHVLAAKAQGATITGITSRELKSLPIPMIRIEEQGRTVTIFKLLKQHIAQSIKLKDRLDELVKSRFIEMFGDPKENPRGWPKKSFEALATLITDGEHKTPERSKEGVYLLSARNVKDHKLDVSDVDYIPEHEYQRIAKRVAPQEGDVLISCSGTIGRCCTVPPGIKFQMVRSAALVRFGEEARPLFMEYQISSDYLQEQIGRHATKSSQANLFQGRIKKLVAIVPPLKLQNEFITFVQQVDKLKFETQQSIDKLQMLYDSLAQEYFGV